MTDFEQEARAVTQRTFEAGRLHGSDDLDPTQWSQEIEMPVAALTAAHEQGLREARLIELDLLEQALNDGRDLQAYKLQRLEALTAALERDNAK